MKKVLIMLVIACLGFMLTSCTQSAQSTERTVNNSIKIVEDDISQSNAEIPSSQMEYYEIFQAFTFSEEDWFFVVELKLEADSPSSDTGIFTIQSGLAAEVDLNPVIDQYELWPSDTINPVGDDSGWDISTFTGTYQRQRLDNAPDTIVLICDVDEGWKDTQYPSQKPSDFPASELPQSLRHISKSISIEQIPSLLLIYGENSDINDENSGVIWIAETAEFYDFFTKFLNLMPKPHILMSYPDRERVASYSRKNVEPKVYYHLLNKTPETPSLIFKAE